MSLGVTTFNRPDNQNEWRTIEAFGLGMAATIALGVFSILSGQFGGIANAHQAIVLGSGMVGTASLMSAIGGAAMLTLWYRSRATSHPTPSE